MLFKSTSVVSPMPESEHQDPANDVARLLIKVGALTMRLEEAIATCQNLQGALIQKEQEIAELKDSAQAVRGDA